jgi:hypothetical protein
MVNSILGLMSILKSWPVTRGWGIHCINITNGEGLWKVTGCMTPAAIADGYLAASNTYDGYMYVFVKAKRNYTFRSTTAITSGTS